MNPMPTIDLYTDGSFRPPHYGGYAAFLQYGSQYKIIANGIPHTTIGRMELLAVVTGLEDLTCPCNVNFYCDSQYVVFTIQKGWIWNWARNGWLTSQGSPVKHRDLMERLIKQLKIHRVNAQWVKGHNGHWQNELCDTFAQDETIKLSRNQG